MTDKKPIHIKAYKGDQLICTLGSWMVPEGDSSQTIIDSTILSDVGWHLFAFFMDGADRLVIERETNDS